MWTRSLASSATWLWRGSVPVGAWPDGAAREPVGVVSPAGAGRMDRLVGVMGATVQTFGRGPGSSPDVWTAQTVHPETSVNMFVVSS